MVGSITWLSMAVFSFVASHLLLSTHPIRGVITDAIGERLFLGLYSLISLSLLVWAARAYAHAPVLDLWHPPTALRHLSLTIMPFACVLVVAGVSTPSPAALSLKPMKQACGDPVGIQRVTRHPVMWGFALWGIAHLLANGDAASCILFLGLTVLALVGAWHIDIRKRRLCGDAWHRFAMRTSFLPFAAFSADQFPVILREIGWRRILGGLSVYMLLVWLHPRLFGVDAWPL